MGSGIILSSVRILSDSTKMCIRDSIYTSTVGETVGCTLQAEIRSPSGSRAAYSGELSLPITGVLNGVHPWSIEHPTLYTLTVQLIRPGSAGLPDRVLDEKTIQMCIRDSCAHSAHFYPITQFYFNQSGP